MQSLIESLRASTGGSLSLVSGMVLAAVLGLWAVFETVRAGWRIYCEQRQQRVTLQKLLYQLEEARLRCREAEQAQHGWNGSRKFAVYRKLRECDDVHSFYLKPHDGRPLPAFKPGQYLTFQLDLPGRDKALIRCYSLSSSPHQTDYYRVTIKKEKAPPDRPDLPPGAGSTYFNDTVREGDILNVKAPAGHFFLELSRMNPIVLIAGGVGVTPMLSMAAAVTASGSKREVWFFYGVRNQSEHIHKAELEKLAAENKNIHLHVCYSRPGSGEVKGRDYHHEGRVSIELLKELLPSNNFEYYLCGNGAFMKSITEGLEAWGVPDGDVHFEAFGPATVKKKVNPPTPMETDLLSKLEVTFSRSGRTVRWDPKAGNLLDFARALNVKIDSGCCAGSCGSCVVAIKSGEVNYLTKPSSPPEAGACLTCVCRPKSNLVIDA